MLKENKKIIIFVGIILISFIIYFIFKADDAEIDELIQSTEKQEIDILSEEVIQTLDKIKTLKLNDNVFNDPIFLRLKESDVRINPEPVGRDNPFERISNQGVEITNIDSSIGN